MIKIKAFLSVICLLLPACLYGQAFVVDSDSHQPVPYAQIVNSRGVTIGVTDANGKFPSDLDSGKVTVMHVAYYPKEVVCRSLGDGSKISLEPRCYSLDEIEVSVKQNDYVHLKTYFRSYQQNDSCLKYYKDGFADFFVRLKNKKIKRYVSHPRVLENRSLTEKDRKRGAAMVDKYIATPYLEKQTLAERLEHGGWNFCKDSLFCTLSHDGKQYGAVRLDTTGHTCVCTYDVLAGEGERNGSLFGFTNRLTDFLQTETYSLRDGIPSYMDLVNMRNYRKIFYKYKKDLREQMVEVVDELYVLDREYLSSEEMKKAVDEIEKSEDCTYPDETVVAPLNGYLNEVLKNGMTIVER